MKLRPASWAVLVLLSGLSAAAVADDQRRPYIVQLGEQPAATYTGGVAGLQATQVANGLRLQAQAPEVLAYSGYLEGKQQNVAATVPGAAVLANYKLVLNGFSALLTEAEALQLKANPDVASVVLDEPRHLLTTTTSSFLGLSAPGGLWSQLSANGKLVKGEDMIVGIIDSGIAPENPAFADQVSEQGTPVFSGGTLAYGSPVGWNGSCVAGPGFEPAIHCNNKLIGAQFFDAIYKTRGKTDDWSEFASSPRDSAGGALAHGGHGTHTASTAAGNSGVSTTVAGVAMGNASGMAPRARIAAYKVCWTYVDDTATDGTGSRNSCYQGDSVSAIERAVADGVHVINYSISGAQISVADPVEQAFLRATTAGVFVAASAGNSGPTAVEPGPVAHISPWLTTVAASSHDREPSARVTLGNGSSYIGASVNQTALPSAPLIRAEDAALSGANATSVRLCFSSSWNGTPVLDPAKVAGKVVICDRGTSDRLDKSRAVAEAGGAGMVMRDNGAGLVAEKHAVPTVHVTAANGDLIRAYAAVQAGNPTADISTFFNASKPAPITAGFSSRGPNAGDSNVMKPDLTAPGVDIIASTSPVMNDAERDAVAAGAAAPAAWESMQGTSMASPHVAGLGALLRQLHPNWSPPAIKSALMTTASATLADGQAGLNNGQLPWGQGAGHVVPNKAMDPGLVYDMGVVDYIRFQCKVNRAAVTPASDCTTYGTLDETYNLNLPSMTVGTVTGPVTLTRRVTNVGTAPAVYTASATLPGFTTVVTPSSLSLNPGETKSFTLRLTVNGAAEGVWNYGSLSWTDGTHVVRSPVQAKAGKPIAAPEETQPGDTISGTRMFPVKTGYAGAMSVVRGGLKEATLSDMVVLTPGTMNSATLRTACLAGQDLPNVKVHEFTIPANTIVARFALRNSDTGAPAADDFDLAVVKTDGSVAAYSGNDGSNEAVQLLSPSAGSYRACVVAYAGNAQMSHRLSSWVVGSVDAASNFMASVPGRVAANSTATAVLAWKGLAVGKRYLGGVQFRDASGVVQAATALRVDTEPQPDSFPAQRAASPKAMLD